MLGVLCSVHWLGCPSRAERTFFFSFRIFSFLFFCVLAMQDFGLRSNLEVLQEFAELGGKRLLDVGCGGFAFTRQLADAGAEVVALDPDAIQAAKNRAELPMQRITFFERGADQLPAADQSVDGVVFAYSLHHVPEAVYPQMLSEILRVLREDGFLHIIEPTDSRHNDVMKLFHDEEQVRAAAQAWIVDAAMPKFESAIHGRYHSFTQYDSFEEFAQRYENKSFNTTYSDYDVRAPQVQALFESLGQPDYRFEQPKLFSHLAGLRRSR